MFYLTFFFDYWIEHLIKILFSFAKLRSQGISSISTTTTTLRSQVTNLNNMITASTRENNGIEQQISLLKQLNTIQNSQISTTERRLDAVKAAVSSASLTSSAAVSSAINTEKEAVSMLDTTSNFQSVSQTAANDASSALSQVFILNRMAFNYDLCFNAVAR